MAATMRRFAFFDKEASKGSVFSVVDVTAVTSQAARIIIGDSEGNIFLCDRDWNTTNFKGFNHRVNALTSVRSGDSLYLVGVGDGADSRTAERRGVGRSGAVRRREERRGEEGRGEERPGEEKGGDGDLEMAQQLGFSMPLSMVSSLSLAADDATYAGFNTGMPGATTGASTPADKAGLHSPFATSITNRLNLTSAAAHLTSSSSASHAAKDDVGAQVKVWRLDRRDTRTGAPECVKSFRVFSSGSGSNSSSKLPERPISAVAVAEDMQQMAIGCVDGTLLLLKGDLTRDMRSIGIMGRSTGLKVSILAEGRGGEGREGASGSTREGREAALTLPPGPVPAYLSVANAEAVTFLAFTPYNDPNAGVSTSVDATAAAVAAVEAAKTSGKDSSVDAADTLADIALALAGYGPGSSKLQASTMDGKADRGIAASVLFCVRNKDAKSFILPRDGKPTMNILDEDSGAAVGCSCLTDNGELVIGCDDAVYTFTAEDKRGAYAFPGKKQQLAWLRHHLIVAAEEDKSASSSTTSAAALVARSRPTSMTNLTVYDLRNKFIAFQLSLAPITAPQPSASSRTSIAPAAQTAIPQFVSFIVREWGQAFVFVSTGAGAGATLGALASASGQDALAVYQLREKDTGTKVDALCKQQLFDTAAAVAQAAGWDKEQVAEIHREHGEYLYSIGDYDGAIAQYIRTVDVVEPSYVIRRFLESQRIQNLTTYLEHLHGVGRATGDHTTLLLNCYTKLRQPEKLRQFITGTALGPSASGHVTFDVAVAITALQDSHCYDEALYLAAMHGEHDAFLRIQIEQRSSIGLGERGLPPVDEAAMDGHQVGLEYIRRLPFALAETQIRKFGRALMGVHPQATTDLLALICTKYIMEASALSIQLGGQSLSLHPVAQASTSKPGQKAADRVRSEHPESFLPLFVDHPLYLKKFLATLQQRAMVGEVPGLTKPLWHALLEVSLRKDVQRLELQEREPELANESDIVASIEKAREEDVLHNILKSMSASYDPDHALVLCQMHDFKPGCLFLYEKVRMYSLVLHQFMESADGARQAGRYQEMRALRREMIRKAKAWGDADSVPDPAVWATIVQYLTRSYKAQGEGGIDDSEALFGEVLKHVDKLAILPPLRVIQIMAENKHIPFGLVREFVVKRLSADEAQIAEDSRAIDSLRAETAAMMSECHRLESVPVVFQQRKCAQCGSDLDLPSIHFMCGGMRGEEHSFHQHCVYEGDNGPECPLCAVDHKHVRDVRTDIATAAGTREQTEQFYRELSSAPDGFIKCAEFLSKGVFARHGASGPETAGFSLY